MIANVYDIEPHTRKEPDMFKMMRFRQAKIDSRFMKSGDNDFSHLLDLYMIQITNFDPFDKDYMLYTIHNSCDEDHDVKCNDGLKFLYFFTKGLIFDGRLRLIYYIMQNALYVLAFLYNGFDIAGSFKKGKDKNE